MVSLGPGCGRLLALLALGLGYTLSGCAGPTADLEDIRKRAICHLAEVDGRLDLLPAGHDALGARLVTLDRDGALAAVRAMDDGRPTGLAMVRIESPRPMIAMVLQVGPAARRRTPVLRHLVNVTVEADTEERESVETWIRSRGGSLLIMSASTGAALPTALVRGSGLDIRTSTDLDAVLLQGLAMAEGAGAAWVLGALSRPTLEALQRFMSQHGESVHLVAVERIMEPPTAPEWLRRCSD